MELDLYPVNVTEKMFKNKIMFNEANNGQGKLDPTSKNNKSLERINCSSNQDL
jgi:hypothetical protein